MIIIDEFEIYGFFHTQTGPFFQKCSNLVIFGLNDTKLWFIGLLSPNHVLIIHILGIKLIPDTLELNIQ